MRKANLPEGLYYPIPEAAEFLGCSIRDVYHYAATGMIKFSIYINEIAKNNVEFISLDLGCRHKGPSTYDSVITIHTDLYSLYDVRHEGDKHNTLTVESISGFFMVPKESCILLEFSSNDFIKLHHLTADIDEEDEFGISLLFDDYVDVPRSCLCIFAEDIRKIKQLSSMEIENINEHPRRANRKGEIIPSLLAMIPEFEGVDIEVESPTKILNILEATAAAKGIELSIPDKNTWGRYLGRTSESRRK